MPIPPAAYPPAPGYAAPPYYGYPPPPGQHRVSRNVRLAIAAGIVIGVLLVGVLGYVVAGFAFASSRISDATSAINASQGHRSYVDSTFDLLDQQVIALDSMRDPNAAKITYGLLITESQRVSSTVAVDDKALLAARSHLNDQQWLTLFSQGRLATEAGRIDHARNAVTNVKLAAHDYVLLGQFLQAFYQAQIDWVDLLAAVDTKDIVAAIAADNAFQADASKALQVSNAPGLPVEYHDFLVAMQAYAADVAKLFNARDQATSDAAAKSIKADIANMNAVTFTGTTAKIRAYYTRYRDTFHAEMDQATA